MTNNPIMQVICVLCWCLIIHVNLVSAESNEEVTGWKINGLQIESSTSEVKVQVESLVWGDDVTLNAINYHCSEQIPIYPKHHCQQATLSVIYQNQAYHAMLDTAVDFQSKQWSAAMTNLGGKLKLQTDSSSNQILADFHDLQLNDLLQLIGIQQEELHLPIANINGTLGFDWQQLQLISQGAISYSGLDYEYSDDIIVAGLNGTLQFSADLKKGQLNYDLTIQAGEMLFDQLYVDFSGYPITFKGVIDAIDDGYKVNSTIINPQSLTVQTEFSFNESLQWQSPSLVAHVFDSHYFNQQILNSILGIYGFGGSEMSGQISLIVNSVSVPFDQWRVEFNDYYFLNERRKLSVDALSGSVNWQQQGPAADSSLSWNSALLTGLPVGQAQTEFNFSADELTLIGLHKFPVFDGAIELTAFEVQKLFSEFVDMQIDATVLPISLKLITEKMGWPIMSGTISGNIPGMHKQGTVIEFLGGLQLQVFDGEMTVDNLSIERLFGVAPVIAGDVMFTGFDLSILTETFGFGLITGKLDGRVDDLRITNWKTDRLDAEVHTVKTQGVKQIISQRAIENISSLGGIKGAISNTFLRFFDDFKYKRIKLSCKLHNSVCQIGGIKNIGNQFTIVEGGGIPKINIVGFVRTIDWDEFMTRLLRPNYDNAQVTSCKDS